MKPKLNLLGFILILIGIPLTIHVTPYIGMIFVFGGVLLFVSFYEKNVFIDFCTNTVNGYEISARQRYYMVPRVPFFEYVKIIYKVEYFKLISKSIEFDEVEKIQLSAKEFKDFRTKQKDLYINNNVSKDVLDAFCDPGDLCIKKKKRKLMIIGIILFLILTMIASGEPIALGLALIYDIPLGIWFWLLLSDYKNDKIKQNAYEYVYKNET